MKRITMWITATLTVIALITAYQLNATGSGGKSGENQQRPVTGQSAATSAGETNDQTGKPGENK